MSASAVSFHLPPGSGVAAFESKPAAVPEKEHNVASFAKLHADIVGASEHEVATPGSEAGKAIAELVETAALPGEVGDAARKAFDSTFLAATPDTRNALTNAVLSHSMRAICSSPPQSPSLVTIGHGLAAPLPPLGNNGGGPQDLLRKHVESRGGNPDLMTSGHQPTTGELIAASAKLKNIEVYPFAVELNGDFGSQQTHLDAASNQALDSGRPVALWMQIGTGAAQRRKLVVIEPQGNGLVRLHARGTASDSPLAGNAGDVFEQTLRTAYTDRSQVTIHNAKDDTGGVLDFQLLQALDANRDDVRGAGGVIREQLDGPSEGMTTDTRSAVEQVVRAKLLDASAGTRAEESHTPFSADRFATVAATASVVLHIPEPTAPTATVSIHVPEQASHVAKPVSSAASARMTELANAAGFPKGAFKAVSNLVDAHCNANGATGPLGEVVAPANRPLLARHVAFAVKKLPEPSRRLAQTTMDSYGVPQSLAKSSMWKYLDQARDAREMKAASNPANYVDGKRVQQKSCLEQKGQTITALPAQLPIRFSMLSAELQKTAVKLQADPTSEALKLQFQNQALEIKSYSESFVAQLDKGIAELEALIADKKVFWVKTDAQKMLKALNQIKNEATRPDSMVQQLVAFSKAAIDPVENIPQAVEAMLA